MARGRKVRGTTAVNSVVAEQPTNGGAARGLDWEQQVVLSERHYRAVKSIYRWEPSPCLCGGHTPQELDNLIRLNGWLESSQRRSLGEYVARALCFGENFNPTDVEYECCCLSEQKAIARTLWAVAIVSYAPQPPLNGDSADQEVVALQSRGGHPQVIENFGASKDLFRTPVGGSRHGTGVRTQMGNISFRDYTLTVPMRAPARAATPGTGSLEDEDNARALALEIESYVDDENQGTELVLFIHNYPTATCFLSLSFILGVKGIGSKELAGIIERQQASAIAWIMSSVTRRMLKPLVIEQRLCDYISNVFEAEQAEAAGGKENDLESRRDTLTDALHRVYDTFGADAEAELITHKWISLVEASSSDERPRLLTIKNRQGGAATSREVVWQPPEGGPGLGRTHSDWVELLAGYYVHAREGYAALLDWSEYFSKREDLSYDHDFLLLNIAGEDFNDIRQRYFVSWLGSSDNVLWNIVPLSVERMREVLFQDESIRRLHDRVLQFYGREWERGEVYKTLTEYFAAVKNKLSEMSEGKQDKYIDIIFGGREFHRLVRNNLVDKDDLTHGWRFANYALWCDLIGGPHGENSWKAILWNSLRVSEKEGDRLGINVGFPGIPSLELLHAWDNVHRLLVGDYARQLTRRQAEAEGKKAARDEADRQAVARFDRIKKEAQNLFKSFQDVTRILNLIKGELNFEGADFLNLYNDSNVADLFGNKMMLWYTGGEGRVDFETVHSAREMNRHTWDVYKSYLTHHGLTRAGLLKQFHELEVKDDDMARQAFRLFKYLVQRPHTQRPDAGHWRIYACQLAGMCWFLSDNDDAPTLDWLVKFDPRGNDWVELSINALLDARNGWVLNQDGMAAGKAYGIRSSGVTTAFVLDALIKLLTVELKTDTEQRVKVESVRVGLYEDWLEMRIDCKNWFTDFEALQSKADPGMHSLESILTTLSNAVEQAGPHLASFNDQEEVLEMADRVAPGFHIIQGKRGGAEKMTVFQLRFKRNV